MNYVELQNFTEMNIEIKEQNCNNFVPYIF